MPSGEAARRPRRRRVGVAQVWRAALRETAGQRRLRQRRVSCGDGFGSSQKDTTGPGPVDGSFAAPGGRPGRSVRAVKATRRVPAPHRWRAVEPVAASWRRIPCLPRSPSLPERQPCTPRGISAKAHRDREHTQRSRHWSFGQRTSCRPPTVSAFDQPQHETDIARLGHSTSQRAKATGLPSPERALSGR